MKISATYRGRLTAAAVILAGAAAVVGALSPAASDEVRPFLQALGIISCSLSGPCQEGKNAGTGAGLEGISAKGKGVIGQTTFNSTSSSNGQAGLLGQDKSTSGAFDVGVNGTSTRGVGVNGTSVNNKGVVGSSSTSDGVVGTSSSGNGVSGLSTSSSGVFASSANGAGVSTSSTNSNGLVARSTHLNGIDAATVNNSTSSGAGASGVFGHDDSSDGGQLNVGVAGLSTNGVGVGGRSYNFVGVNAVGGVNLSEIVFPALSVVGNNAAQSLIAACSGGTHNPCDGGDSVFDVLSDGNVEISGRIFTAGSCVTGCVATPSSGEKRVRFYTPRESLPTVEDFGEAQLVNGQVYVRIDPAFANTMDIRATYMVFITPKGDNRGLYVTDESATGFEVRESQGGRSTLTFDYRIVAKPFGEHPVRLQMITVSKPGKSLPPSRLR